MEEYEREWILEAREKVGKLTSVIDKDSTDKLLLVYTLENDGKEEIKQEIDLLIDTFSNALLFSKKPVMECPSRIESQGEIRIGRVMQGDKVLWEIGLTKEELNQHMLITSRSGAGKTTLIVNILVELIRLGVPFLACDFKRDLRDLIKFYPGLWVFRYEDLRLNLLQPPPGVSLQKWEQLFCDLYAFNYGWFHGSRNLMQEYLHDLYQEKGDRATLLQLYQIVKEAKARTRRTEEYHDVVTNRLFSTVTNLASVIDCERGYPIERILEHPTVIELDQLARDEQNLLVIYFLSWIYAYRLAQGHRRVLRHALVFDEGKRVFDVNKEFRETTTELGVTPIDIITDEIRDFGEALIVADQEPSKLTHSIKANSFSKITGCLGHGRDIYEISEAMNLNDEEREAITNLERGEWLVKLAGRYTKPFMIHSEDFPLEKNVTDEELQEYMKPITASLMPKESKQLPTKEEVHEVQEDAWGLLSHVNSHPFNGIVGRAKELKFSGRRIESAKQELLRRGLVREVGITLTAKKPTLFLIPTQQGLELLEPKGADIGLWRYIGNVGFEHVLYQVLIRYKYKELGYTTSIEAKLCNGRRLDVLAVKDNKRTGVEIELNPQNSQDNKLKGIDELDELYIISNSEDKLKTIQSKLNADDKQKEKIKMATIGGFLKQLSNIKRNNSGIYSSEQDSMEFDRKRNLIGEEEG